MGLGVYFQSKKYTAYDPLKDVIQIIIIISSLINSLQIEDAMLMFDKQTNRHRGKWNLELKLFTSDPYIGLGNS